MPDDPSVVTPPPSASERFACRLPDGRLLGYAEYGDPDGTPMMLFHGTPGSRLMLRIGDAAAQSARIRLIAPDRPGIGLSDPLAGRRIADWPDDVAVLADRLGLSRFAVCGISGGGPYALACARYISERLSVVGIVSGMGPPDAPGAVRMLRARYRAILGLARAGGFPYRLIAGGLAEALTRWPDTFLSWMARNEPPADRVLLGAPVVRNILIASMLEAMRRGPDAVIHEIALMARPWGFDLADIAGPVLMWHGDGDAIAPAALARYSAERIPDARLRLVGGAGHFWGFANVEEILRELRSAAA